MEREVVATTQAPAAIGTYSQAITLGNLIFCSGQIGLDPVKMSLVDGRIEAQARQAFANLGAIAQAAGGSLDDVVKLTVFLTDLQDYSDLNRIMSEFFSAPFPARSVVQVSGLPRGACVEVEAFISL